MRKRSVAAVLASAATLVGAALAAPPGAGAQERRQPVPHTRPAWLDRAQHLGPADPGAPVQARVYLTPAGGVAALQQAAAAVSTPGSASYHRFLTPAQYTARYAPTERQVQQVRAWLAADGAQVTGVEATHRYLTVQTTVAAAQRAFGTAIERYRHDGQTVQAPSGAVTVPGPVAGSVLTVTGLDSTSTRVAPASSPPPFPAGFRNARPCSQWFGQLAAAYQADGTTPLPKFHGRTLPYAPCGYTGPQLRAAYEGATPLDGAGVTVAITDAYAAPTIASDAGTYAVDHGDGGYARGQFSQAHPPVFTHQADCGPTGWYGEETLDVEAVHAMAPGAAIRYYPSASCLDTDFIDTLHTVLAENRAQLVTNSWGGPESATTSDLVAAYEQVFLQGAMQGISFLFSSGDNGDELANTGLKQTDYPASDPYVTSVGGTSTAIGADGTLAYETGWGTVKYSLSPTGTSWNQVGFLYGAGGGTSALFNQPGYQNGVAPGGSRSVPDVAMDADPNTGMLIGQTQQFPTGIAYGEYRIGGTSLASPLFAGMTALALQHAGGQGAGALNPVIYGNTGAFQDVKGTPPDAGDVRVDYANGVDATAGLRYSVRTFNQDSSLTVGTGWDPVTGVGSPTAAWLAAIPAG